MVRTANIVLFFILAFLSIGVGLYALAYYFTDFPFLQSKGSLPSEIKWNIPFYIHVGSGGMALGIGWLQFWKKFRLQNINRHRLIGKIYVASIIFFASTSGQYLAWYSNDGFPAHLGFAFLSFVWFYTTLKAYLAIRRKEVTSHREWMMRSYAITFASVTLRIWFPLFQFAFGLPHHDAYTASSWFCWIPNLLFVEWFLLNKPSAKNRPLLGIIR